MKKTTKKELAKLIGTIKANNWIHTKDRKPKEFDKIVKEVYRIEMQYSTKQEMKNIIQNITIY